MAGVKTERSAAGHKTPPRRPKDWVAPVKRIVIGLPKGHPGFDFTPAVPVKEARTDDEKAAVVAYEAAMKSLNQCKPNDTGAENARQVAYQRLVRLGLRPQVRGRLRGI